MAQVPVKNRDNNQCPNHGKEIILSCIDCNGQLVCSHCITSKHQHHSFENISQVAKKKTRIIQDYINIAEKTQLPTITNILQSIDLQSEENTNLFQNVEKVITLHGEKMKKEIDKITHELTENCKEIAKQNSKLLSKYRMDIESLYTQLNQTIDRFKDTLKTKNDVLIIDAVKDVQQELQLPSVPKCRTVKFTEGPMSFKHLHDDFGSLSVKEGQDILLPKPVVEKYRFNDSTVVSKFTHLSDVTCVEKSTLDSVWLSSNMYKHISLVTLQGKVKRTLELDKYVQDISVSPVTGNLWLCCRYDHTVYEVSDNIPTTCFTPASWPMYLCMTSDNKAAVITNDHIVTVYSTTGQLLHSTQRSGSVVYPHHVTVCTSTGDIAVCDSDYGGKGKPHVSIFNSKLDLKYQYYGSRESAMKSDFCPKDIVYDLQGHLLIVDDNNKCIQLVTGEGQFLTVVYIDTLQPKVLTLIQDGLLCVCFDDRKIKVIRYRV